MFVTLEVNHKGMLKIETSGQLTISDAFLIIMNGSLAMAKQAVANAPEADKEKVKGALYDMMNLRFTGVLETFAPEYDLRPGLTEEAIMKAENDLMGEEVAKADAMPKMSE
jgi:hypothetical protein